VVAAFLSAFIPGTGQLFLGQRRKGSILLVSLVILALCFWPLRLPRFYAAFVVVSWFYIALCLYSPSASSELGEHGLQDFGASQSLHPQWSQPSVWVIAWSLI